MQADHRRETKRLYRNHSGTGPYPPLSIDLEHIPVYYNYLELIYYKC